MIKELGLLEKHLPTYGAYVDAEYDISWADYSSGGPIANQMLTNKLNFGVMGDYPLIVNGAKFRETDSLRTLYVAGTGYNLKGSGNAIVVPVDSDIYSSLNWPARKCRRRWALRPGACCSKRCRTMASLQATTC